jgi:hypothetical protein
MLDFFFQRKSQMTLGSADLAIACGVLANAVARAIVLTTLKRTIVTHPSTLTLAQRCLTTSEYRIITRKRGKLIKKKKKKNKKN